MLFVKWKRGSEMENEKYISTGIDNFLTFLREIEQNHSIFLSVEQDANDETQDILHIIELRETGQAEIIELYDKLKEVRCKRRKAKDYILQTVPVINWTEENKTVIKGLEKLLGEVRKNERYTQNRIFTAKTRIAQEMFKTENQE